MFDWIDDGLTPYLIEEYELKVKSFDEDESFSREHVYLQILGEMQNMDAGINGAIISTAGYRNKHNTDQIHFSEMLRSDFFINQESGDAVLEKIATAVLMAQILEILRAEENSS